MGRKAKKCLLSRIIVLPLQPPATFRGRANSINYGYERAIVRALSFAPIQTEDR